MPEGIVVNHVLSCDISMFDAAATTFLSSRIMIDVTARRRGDALAFSGAFDIHTLFYLRQ